MPLSPKLTEADLEVLILREAHSVMSRIIGDDYYVTLGEPPNQNVLPHTRKSFDLFFVFFIELVTEAHMGINLDGENKKITLLRGLSVIARKYPDSAAKSGLDKATAVLEEWVARTVSTRFWCPSLDEQLSFKLTNYQFVNTVGNAAKHHILRLEQVIERVGKWCERSGKRISPDDRLTVLESLLEKCRDILEYQFSTIVEMVGGLLVGVCEFVRVHYSYVRQKDGRTLDFPPGLSSDVFKGVFIDVLRIRRLPLDSLRKHIPVVTPILKNRYRPAKKHLKNRGK